MFDDFIFGSEKVFFFVGSEVDMNDSRVFGEYPEFSQVVLIDRFHIIGELGGGADIYLPEAVFPGGIEYQSVIRSQCQHLFSQGGHVIYFAVRIRDIYELQLLGVEIVFG